MATEEKLTIELDARTKKLDAKLQATENKLDKLGGAVKKNDKGFAAMGQTAKTLAGGLAKVATIAVAVNAAISAMVLASASNRRELETLSRQAKTTAEDFQALAFATKTYGINADQIADISKDISDKVGEFSAAGTGAFQDYADVMKLTKGEARKVAQEFESMSSQQVLGEMVSKMESAGVSGDKMTFVLESMGNDLSKILPLLKDGSRELLELKGRFEGVNSSMKITAEQSKSLNELTTSFDLMKSSIGNATTAISATLAPVMDEFFNDIIEVVPTATQAIVNLINTMRSPEEINAVKDINEQLEISREKLDRLSPVAERVGKIRVENKAALNVLTTTQERLAEKEFETELKRYHLLKDQKLLIEETIEAQRVADAERLEGKKIGGSTGEDIQDGSGIGTGDQISAIEDRFKTETELLTEKYELEQEMLGEHHANLLDLEEEYLQALIDIDDKKEQATAEAIAKKAELKSKAAKAEIDLEKSVANNAVALTKMVLGDEKAAALLGLAMQKASALSANATATASGSMLAYASQLIPGDPTSIARAEAARDYTIGLGTVNAGLIVATGLGEAAGIMSGGGGGSFSGDSGSSSSETQNTRDFEQETARLEVSDSTDEGSTVQTINFSTDSGDELIDAIAAALNKAQIEGRA